MLIQTNHLLLKLMHRNLHSEVFYHNREFHLIVFHLQKFIPAEINYDMNDNEFLAIVDSFEQWRSFMKY